MFNVDANHYAKPIPKEEEGIGYIKTGGIHLILVSFKNSDLLLLLFEFINSHITFFSITSSSRFKIANLSKKIEKLTKMFMSEDVNVIKENLASVTEKLVKMLIKLTFVADTKE